MAVLEPGTASPASPSVVVVSSRPGLTEVPLSASGPPIAASSPEVVVLEVVFLSPEVVFLSPEVVVPEVVSPAGSSVDPIHPSQKLDLEL